MATTVIDEFIITLGLDPADFEKESDAFNAKLDRDKNLALRRGKELERSAKTQGQAMGGLKGQLVGLIGVFGGVAGVTGFVSSLTKGDAALGRISRQFGVSAQEIAQWQGVLKGAGGTAEDAANDLGVLVNAYKDIRTVGTSSLIPYMNLLGLGLEDLRNPSEALLKIADKLAAMDPVIASGIARDMGFSPAMVSTLIKGRAATASLYDEQRKLTTVTKENTEAAEKLQREWANLGTSAKDLGRSIMSEVVGPLTGAVDAINAVIAAGKEVRAEPGERLATAEAKAVAVRRERDEKRAREATEARGGTYTPPAAGRGPTARGGGGRGRRVPEPREGGWRAWAPERPEWLPPMRAPAPRRSPPARPRAAATAVPQGTRERFDYTVQFFTRQGWTLPQARGMAAGIYAESRLDPRAANPESSARGLGQWLTPRQKDFERVIGKPVMESTFDEQLRFLQWELENTERTRAGDKIRETKTAPDALRSYIVDFMRPKKGYETTSDLERGHNALAWREGGRTGGTGTAPVDQSTSYTIGTMTVTTQATDAQSLARDFPDALGRAVPQANTGLR